MDLKRVNRKYSELREISFQNKFSPYAEGSCFVKFGNTHIICTASVEEKVPMWLRGRHQGWITAEYGMIPRATHSRVDRDISKGKISGRSQEIQRLIGRSLRSSINLNELGERQIKIDCDVIQADGGTRTASISGAWIALYDAVKFLLTKGIITKNPIKNQIAAISCGIINEEIRIDLDYTEDSSASVDGNFVLTDNKEIIEIQSSSEQKPISKSNFLKMYGLVEDNIDIIFKKQRDTLSL
ncbi:ribonuclease PH [Alphaproteobacteria bacterium]|nr:ribonuclease PH [Alphaproteobacteria bacterium]